MLTDAVIKKIQGDKKVKVYPDSNGLYLRVSKKKKRWQVTTTKKGKTEHTYGGYWPEQSLASARAWAALIKKDGPPVKVKRSDKTKLKFFVEEFVASKEARRSEETLKKYKHCIDKYVSKMWDRDVQTYSPDDILDLIMPINKAGYAMRVREVLWVVKNAFTRAQIRALIPSNPCDNLYLMLDERNKVSHAAITDLVGYGEFLRALDSISARPAVRNAIRALPYVFTRPNELLGAEWPEFNFEEHTWTIPGERMKMKEPLIVPMSRQFEALILELKPITGHEKFVFTAYPGKKITDNVMRNYYNSVGYYGNKTPNPPENAKYHSPHGNRASFSTIAQDVLKWQKTIIEMQLAHATKDPNGKAYDRAQFLEERAKMMQLWADFLDLLKENDKEKIKAFIEKNKGAI